MRFLALFILMTVYGILSIILNTATPFSVASLLARAINSYPTTCRLEFRSFTRSNFGGVVGNNHIIGNRFWNPLEISCAIKAIQNTILELKLI